MTIKTKQTFSCECCDRSWSRRYEYDRHLTSAKHEKMRQKSKECSTNSKECSTNGKECSANGKECSKIVEKIHEKPILTTFCCYYCQFTCSTKKEAEKHRNTKQHIRNENKEEDFLEIVNRYTCRKCDKYYDKYISCWKHSKTCQRKKENIGPNLTPKEFVDFPHTFGVGKITNNEGRRPELFVTETTVITEPIAVFQTEELIPEVKDNTLETMVEKILEKKNVTIMETMMEKMVSVMEKMSETIANTQQGIVQTNNNNNTNHNTIIQNNNNHYTINMFLNEKCKDAINISDWVHQLKVDYDHLYYTGANGFQKGLTNMLLDNLKLCNVYNRPIHFTDIKRDSMYIRDADAWTKHENTEKLIEMLEVSARQACFRLTEWMREHEDVPEYHDLDSELGQQYLALMVTVIRPEVERLKAFPKVIKELAKTAQLRKEDQV